MILNHKVDVGQVGGSKYPPAPNTPCAPHLETIFHQIIAATSRLDDLEGQLADHMRRLHGPWPVAASNAECGPSGEGLLPAVAVACDRLNAVIQRLDETMDCVRRL